MQHGEGRLQELSGSSLRRLHRSAIDSADAVRDLLQRLKERGTTLGSGVDRRSAPRRAQIEWIGEDRVGLRTDNLEFAGQPQIYFQFELDGDRYFFATLPLPTGKGEALEIAIPSAIYEVERRDLHRERQTPESAAPIRVELQRPGQDPAAAEVRDWSYQGMGVAVPQDPFNGLGSTATLRFLDGEREGELQRAELRHRQLDSERPGWVRLGLSVTQVTNHQSIPVESRDNILDEGLGTRAWRRIELASALARDGGRRVARRVLRSSTASAPEIEIVEYPNDRGQTLRAIVDSTGERRGAPAVLIAPAWGRTKETLMPLARTLLRTFEKAGEPLVVLRFDGSNRRGESHIDPECTAPGDEYLHFTFTQAVRDIEAGIDFLEQDANFASREILLVTYSLGAVEGRRAVALDAGRRLKGWISVVGMVDLQSGLRTISGGVDYAYGLSRGVGFGRHELVGVAADMDHTGLDALASKLVFAEDAHRDMAQIELPITWIHGRHDAWMELERVRALLSAGSTERRRLIEVPTGHQLRSSREGLETFQLVSGEAFRMLRGREVRPALPDLTELEQRNRAERSRRPKPDIELRDFWEDYLLGRDRRLGIELMTATSPYRELMALQIQRLRLESGDHVLDLGAGTGDFSMLLAEHADRPGPLSVTAVDYVTDALRRGAERFATRTRPNGLARHDIELQQVNADLNLARGRCIPFVEGAADAALASLVVSYLEHPEELLAGVFRSLRSGGRLVLSSLRRDADISKIYVQGISELPPDRVEALFGSTAVDEFEVLQRRFLNDAARLLDLEEAGQFRFWDESEFAELARDAGFVDVETEMSFGDPAQAVVLSARRP